MAHKEEEIQPETVCCHGELRLVTEEFQRSGIRFQRSFLVVGGFGGSASFEDDSKERFFRYPPSLAGNNRRIQRSLKDL